MSYDITLGGYEINITYNYCKYYYNVYKKGIREIYGLTGKDSISILSQMINTIVAQNTGPKGEWLTNKRIIHKAYLKTSGREVSFPDLLKSSYTTDDYNVKDVTISYNEGDVNDYWFATAANALKPLYMMRDAARLYPDEVWEGD